MKAFISLAFALALAAPVAAQERAIAVVAMKSTSEPFVDSLLLRGRTEANRRVEVRSETSGLVVSNPLPKGRMINKGALLCQIDDGDKQAELREAQAVLAEKEIEFNAADRLAKRGFGAETAAAAAAASLEAARARVFRAEMNIGRLEVHAPFGGVLETDTAELGELMQNGSVCATVISLHPIKLVAFAPERSVDKLKRGAEVRARLITGQEVEARITHVARSADRDTRTYLVEAEAENKQLLIRDGMTAELQIVLEGQPAHRLPQTALTLNSAGDLGVRVVEEGKARFRPVVILRDEPSGVWVAGLEREVDVIVVGQEFVTDGRTVSVEYMDPEVGQ